MGSRMRTSIYWEDADIEALRVIRQHHGLPTNTAAARFAIRQVADQIEWREADRRRALGERVAPQQPEGAQDGAKGKPARGKQDGAVRE